MADKSHTLVLAVAVAFAGILVSLAILFAGRPALKPATKSTAVGRYMLMTVPKDSRGNNPVYRLDTATGETRRLTTYTVTADPDPSLPEGFSTVYTEKTVWNPPFPEWDGKSE